MDRQSGSHLKKLLEAVPHGFFVNSTWFKKQGISRQLVSQYVKNGWLERAAQGVYRRPDKQSSDANIDLHDWEMVVLSMQKIMELDLHVGGSTALRRRGHGHYVSMGNNETVFLYGQKIPNWLKSTSTNADFETRNCKLFVDQRLSLEVDDDLEGSFQPPWRWPMGMSSPERAILEALDELPEKESFHTVDMMFQGLVNLRPRRVMELLKSCTSIKVKRLFFVYADRHNHAWRKHINENDINLGSGDRALVKGGKLHPKYRIMIPEDLLPKTKREIDESS